MMHAIAHNSRRHKAFTMIEILVTIGIILILATLVIVGVGKIAKTIGGSSAKVDVQNLQSMLGELETSAALTTTLSPLDPNASAAAPGDVREVAYEGSTSTNPPPKLDRWQSIAVVRTQLVMGKLRGIPKNRAAIQALPGEKLMKAQSGGANYGNGAPIATTGGLHGTPNPPLLVDAWNNPIIFVPG